MTPARKALIASSLIEAVGCLLFVVSYFSGWSSTIGGVLLVLHYPAVRALYMFSSARYLSQVQTGLSLLLLQWIFWFIVLGVAFLYVEIWRKNNGKK